MIGSLHFNRSLFYSLIRVSVFRSFERGWDEKHQGLFYFLDSEGRSPPYLEWNMKLWWPHCETLVAYAMLYQHSHCEEDWKRFVKTAEYTFQHFSDAKNGGEWFGYLDQEGRVTHRFKGGPYKGCFHVPRSLFFVYEILDGPPKIQRHITA